jgi:DinB superfamily
MRLRDSPDRRLTVPSELDSLIAKMSQAHCAFLCAADAIPSERWKTKPSDGRWSAAELVAHLTMVERAVIEKADRVSQKPPKRIPFFKKMHLPMALVERRLVRRKSPVPIDPELLGDKEAMLARLREVRERSLAFLEETRERNLREYCWKHPAIGMLNTYGWLRFVAAHETRHAKQMREIATDLPKAIETLQK